MIRLRHDAVGIHDALGVVIFHPRLIVQHFVIGGLQELLAADSAGENHTSFTVDAVELENILRQVDTDYVNLLD